jgi:hypothetical protein
MKRLTLFTFCLWILAIASGTAQPTWPKEIVTKGGAKINIYQPTPEKFNNNILNARAAISVETKPGADLIFGAFWTTAKVSTDRETRMVELESIKVDNVKFPDITDTAKINQLKALLETEIPKWGLKISLDELVATIEQENPPKGDELKNDPPKVIYADKSTQLVVIEGEPKLEVDKNMKLKRVINTQFLIVQDGKSAAYYLYGGKFWYTSKSIKEGWTSTTKLPDTIAQIDKHIKEKAKEAAQQPDSLQPKSPQAIIVATEPTELIQSKGKAVFKPIETTSLLYVDNSDNYIFMEINSQQYYILLSGRWYQSKSLEGPWSYVAADKIAPDFAKIPEGTDMDVVLASVAGTPAAKEAVMDAQIPQTAKVDRKTATTKVEYDGEPKFEKIEGTDMEVAKNTSSTVIKDKDKYYAVKDGIWFMATVATGGLWAVANERPSEMDKVPPSSEVYNTKYVEIYETTPEYVYVGYTPGYMGCYVYGPTVVYGTGFIYPPFWGPFYYPHPVTYGYGFAYNPYLGFSMGVAFSMGCFAFHAAYRAPYGCWGPHGYHPPYGYHGGGYYGHHASHYGNTNINVNRNNNIYRGNNGVSTRDIQRGNSATQQPARGGDRNGGGRGSQPGASQQPAGGGGRGSQPGASQQPAGGGRGSQPGASQQPAGGDRGGAGASQQPAGGGGDRGGAGPSQQPAGGGGDRGGAGPSQQPAGGGGKLSQQAGATQQPSMRDNNVKADRDGNVYRQNNDGSMQQRNNNQWQNSDRSNKNVNQSYQNSDRGQTRNNNFNSQGGGSRYSGGGGGGSRGGGGGGSRGGGGRGGGGRR